MKTLTTGFPKIEWGFKLSWQCNPCFKLQERTLELPVSGLQDADFSLSGGKCVGESAVSFEKVFTKWVIEVCQWGAFVVESRSRAHKRFSVACL